MLLITVGSMTIPKVVGGRVNRPQARSAHVGQPVRRPDREQNYVDRSRLTRSVTKPFFATALLGTATLILTTGCASDVDTPPSPAAPSPVVEVALPSPAEIEYKIYRATDPEVRSSEKVPLVEGSESDPQLFDDITRLQAQSPARLTVLDVEPGDSPYSAIARTRVEQDGQEPTEVEALLVYVDDAWRLSSRFVCGLISNSQFELPVACQP